MIANNLRMKRKLVSNFFEHLYRQSFNDATSPARKPVAQRPVPGTLPETQPDPTLRKQVLSDPMHLKTHARTPVSIQGREPVLEHVKEPVLAPFREPVLAPTIEPALAPIREPVLEPTREPALAPRTEPVSLPVRLPTPSPIQSEQPRFLSRQQPAPSGDIFSVPIEEATSPGGRGVTDIFSSTGGVASLPFSTGISNRVF